jgi:hypothetical protein
LRRFAVAFAALTLAVLLISGTALALTNGVSVDHSQGIIILGSGTANCKTATKGGIRYNSTTPNLEFCNGTTWQPLAAVASSCGSPSGLSFTNLTAQSLSTVVNSNTATILFSGCNTPLAASVTGGGSAQISVNNGAWTTSTSILSGQTLQVRMTTSASVSTLVSSTVTVGGSTANWTTTTRPATLKIFTTAYGYSGDSIGGLAQADAICQTEANAAGYAGVYKAVMSDDYTSAASRLTLSYPIVNAYDGSTVSAANLWSGSISTNVLTPSGSIWQSYWTGSNWDGSATVGNTCNNWTAATMAYWGDGSQTGTGWMINYSYYCYGNYLRGLLCIQQ